MGIEKMLERVPQEKLEIAQAFKKKLLEYQNPVEFVNNMYGCHPDEVGGNYFQTVYQR
jgi:hypothetical protein